MDAQVIIMQQELLSLSPEVCTQAREDTIIRQVLTGIAMPIQGMLQSIGEDEYIAYDSAPTFVLGQAANQPLPKGVFIVKDPIETYYNLLGPGEEPNIDQLTVAKGSTVIRSIIAMVDTRKKKECMVNPGCQVVAMSEMACHSLALTYDPRIHLNMESTNGTLTGP